MPRPNDVAAPRALVLSAHNGVRLYAVDAAASSLGLAPYMTLSEARALVPELATAPADPPGDLAALLRLADWAGRYTPLVALDGIDGLVLDITGCAHLFGGEAAMLADLRRLLDRFGLTARVAVAATPAAAWAWARFGRGDTPADRRALHALPPAALRLPEEMALRLDRLGLRRIGDLAQLPRAPLTARFGTLPGERLDRLHGDAPEPITPCRPAPPWRVRLAFAEPIARHEDIAAGLDHLLAALCGELAAGDQGAREMTFRVYRVDGSTQALRIGTARPLRTPGLLTRLFAERLGEIDPGFGLETLVLEAGVTAPQGPEQDDLDAQSAAEQATREAQLIDRLVNWLGPDRVRRPWGVESHLPERAVAWRSASEPGPPDRSHPAAMRPLRLMPRPEPAAVEQAEGRKLATLHWRRVARPLVRADGPERIAPEWWRAPDSATRDYYRVEDAAGRRYWIYREPAGNWFLHGLAP